MPSILRSLAISGAALAAACADSPAPAPLVATSLSFQTQPVAAVKDTAMPGVVRVAVLDQNGSVLTSNTTAITLALGANPGGAMLSGTPIAGAVAGVATFSGLSLNAVGTGYTLVASATGLANATSAAFNVTLSLTDADGDGFAPNAGDCNDAAAGVHPNATDLPDAAFEDSNCDGIDGDAARAIFTAPTGSDGAACGVMATPCRTVSFAITRAVTDAKRDVYVAAGTYTGAVTLAGGVSVYGGYTSTWTRNGSFGTVFTGALFNVGTGGQQALTVYGANLTQTVVVADVRIVAPNATGTVQGRGRSSHGVVLRDVAPGVVSLTRLQIESGNGAVGANGTPGSNASGTAAAGGVQGQNAAELSTTCNSTTRGNGGGAGTNVVTAGRNPNGGGGGPGGAVDTDCSSALPFEWDFTARPGTAGSNAAFSVSVFGTGGAGGTGGTACGVAQDGRDGQIQNGAAGPGAGTAGLLVDGFWYAKDGQDGGLGDNGSGGGGGGGSGGCDTGVPDAYGAGGGGGGAGGARAPGTAGGGSGGGGSFGIYLINASPTITSVTIARGVGGDGGTGGTGGRGQSGGLGAPGGNAAGSARAGGRGGDGAHGGHGGGGGGGAGGISAGIYRSSGASVVTSTGVTITGGSAGGGGTGGPSAPTAPTAERDGVNGGTGANGALLTTGVCATPASC